MSNFDVLVLGAGAAGLAAAHVLSRHGMNVGVIEARDRLGGRVFTSRLYGHLPTELGAEFIHGRPQISFSIARAAGLTLSELSGDDWISANGRFYQADDQDESLQSFSDAVASWDKSDTSVRQLMDARFSGDRWETTRRWATRYVEEFDAAPLDDVSVHWLARDAAAEAPIDGDRQFRILEGYDRLLDWLREHRQSERARYYLRTIVREIHWAPGHVEVKTLARFGGEIQTMTARSAVITLPVGVLSLPPEEPSGVRFVPDLPEKRDALSQVAMGQVVKVLLHFREPFWDCGLPAFPSLPRLSFLFSDHDAMSTWWTHAPLLTPTLIGWVGGPRAGQLAFRTDETIVKQAKDAVAHAFHLTGRQVDEQLIGTEFHNWSADPFSRGAYSYTRVGGLEAQRRLAEPIMDTLFFAGEATHHSGQSATVHGALETGERAAGEIVSRLSSKA